MVSLRIFIVVLATLVCRELGGAAPKIELTTSFIAMLAVTLGCGLLTKLAAVGVARRSGEPRFSASSSADAFVRSRNRVDIAWALLLPVTLLLTGWVPWVNALAETGAPQTLLTSLLFLPAVMFIGFQELSAAQMDDFLSHRSRAESIEGELGHPGPVHCWESWWLRVRLGDLAHLMMCLMPVMLIAVCGDLVGPWLPHWSEVQRSVLAALLAMSAVILVYPFWMGRWMGVESFSDPRLLKRIRGLCEAMQIQRLQVGMIPSEGRWNGAAMVGWLPFFRRLWIGDGLVQRLSDRQFDMVILHELAHIRRWHFAWRVMPVVWALGFTGIYYFLTMFLPGGSSSSWILHGVCVVLASALLVFGLGHISRICELDADRTACQAAMRVCEWAQGENHRLATIELADALRIISGQDADLSVRSWLHPSLRERFVALAKVSAGQPAEAVS